MTSSADTSFAHPSMNFSSPTQARRQKRREKQQERSKALGTPTLTPPVGNTTASDAMGDKRFSSLMVRNEDKLLKFVAEVNRVYQDLLHKDAPFMTFVLCGVQSAGKSSIMERFLNAVLNIVQDGTGTRCPLDTTCIHDAHCTTPVCELQGSELATGGGKDLSIEEVFTQIVNHNKRLGDEDRFSTNPLYLVFKSSKVQNMRFVDTPGLISTNTGTGKDNRKDIQEILRGEIEKPNTKLCVLLQPDELANNPIIDFCDKTFGETHWRSNAIFLMTKFDRQLGDTKSASKTNELLSNFFKSNCYPHLVITGTLPIDKLPPDELFLERQKLLNNADEYETKAFKQWRANMEEFQRSHSDEELHPEIARRIGFSTARDEMRRIMLTDIIERIPEVITSLRSDLSSCEAEYELLLEKKKMSSASEVKLVAHQMLYGIQDKLKSYLDGNLAVASKFPEMMQTLEDEIDNEETSDWKDRRLNHHLDKEDEWRDRIADLDESEFSVEIHPDERFLGGKQYQRAIEFFKVVMISALPDPHEIKELIPQATGFGQDGLQRENWERAMVETVKECLQGVSQPGVNYLIKHAGAIFRDLFQVAIKDVKKGEEFSRKFENLPGSVEKLMTVEYERMLWELMERAAEATHLSLEPMFSTIDPSLPTFDSEKGDPAPENHTAPEQSLLEKVNKFTTELRSLVTNDEAKQQMRKSSIERLTTKKFFLPDERASMITKAESEMIVTRSFEYIIALFEFILSLLKFQLNHHLYTGFKKAIQGKLITRMDNIEWEELVQNDEMHEIESRLEVLEQQMDGLRGSLQDVKKMEHGL